MSSGVSPGRPATRTAILGAARFVFERDGFHGTGLEEVAREAGVSRQAVYLHFGSKGSLVVALFQHVNDLERMGERLQEITDAASGLEAMERWVRLNADTLSRILPLSVELDIARRCEAEADAVWRSLAQDRRRWCRRIVRRLSDEGRLAEGWSVGIAADLLWAITLPGPYKDLVADGGWTQPRYVRYVIALVRRAFVSE